MSQRFSAARAAGFDGVEILFPYDFATNELRHSALREGLDFVMLNAPPPNWAGGPRGFAAEPGHEARFRHDFDRALRFAEGLHARHILIMSGKAEGPQAESVFIDNLRWAAARAPHASLLIEPCNSVDLPGGFLNGLDQAATILDAAGGPNIGLLFDAYHVHMIGGGTAEAVGEAYSAHHQRVRHIQIAGAPGRHEPHSGEIDYPAFMRAVQDSGYTGWISAEYAPRTTTEAGLRWLKGAAKG